MQRAATFIARVTRDGDGFDALSPEFLEGNGQGRTGEKLVASLRASTLLLLENLQQDATTLKLEGEPHSIHWNPATGRREPVPRHAEIPDLLVRTVCQALQRQEP